MAARYKGFSSFEFQDKKTFDLNDVEIVKMDLLNHIFTRRGERVMMPDFGTIIPDLLFEPLDEETVDIINDEVEDVLNYDPRVEIVELDVQPNYDANAVTVAALVRYIELNTVELFDFNIEFEGAG